MRSNLKPFLVVCVLMSVTPWYQGIQAQTVKVSEINPTRSTLDATDADGASGGRVNGLGTTRDGGTYYAASEWGGLYKSTDAGRVWRHLDSHLPTATWDVEVDPSDSSRVYATSFYDGRLTSLAGINVSGNGGRSWSHPVTATPPAGFCASAARRDEPSAFGISIDPSDARRVFVGTNCGLAVSTDRGFTWAFIDPTPADPADNIWDVEVHDGLIDLCGDDGHQRSTDGGATWTTATGVGLPAGRCSLTYSPDESYVLLAVSGMTIYESDDAGATWPTTLTNPNPQGRIPFVSTNQRSGNGVDLWFGDVGLYRATCTTPTTPAIGGTARCPVNTWTGPFTRAAGAHDDVGAMIFEPNVTVDACPRLLSSDGGVYYNTLATSPGCHSPAWEQPDTTPRSLWVFGMDGADQTGTATEDLYFGNQDNGTFASTNAGAATPTWNNRNCCDGFDVSAAPTRVLYTVCCRNTGRANRLFLRNQGMVGGAEINTYPAGNLAGFRAPDIIDRFGPDDYVLVTTSGVFITTNITVNPIVWSQLGSASSPIGARAVKTADSSGTPVFYVLAGNADGRTPDRLWRYVGTGTGGTWRQINRPAGVGGFGIFDVDPGNADRLFASHLRFGSEPQMILSNDAGANWANLPALDQLMTGGGAFRYRNQTGPTDFTGFNGYPQPTLVAFDPRDRNTLVAGAADAGVFVTTNGGTSWITVSDPSSPCCSGRPHIPRPRFTYFDHEPVAFLRSTTTIYLGTQGRGLWKISLERRNVLVFCKLVPDLCNFRPRLDRNLMVLECTRRPCGIVIDPIPKNCLVKFDCPGCGPGGLCPPYYHLFLEDLDTRVWKPELFTGSGEPADFELFRTRTGIVLSFRPTKELFRSKEIGDYLLAFVPSKVAGKGSYRIRTRLEVSDKPYKGATRLRRTIEQ